MIFFIGYHWHWCHANGKKNYHWQIKVTNGSTLYAPIIWLFPYHIPYQPETPISSRALGMILVSRVDTGCDTERASSGWYWCLGLIRDVIRKEPYHIMFIIYLNMRKFCSVLWTFSHVINIILRGMIKGWWYRHQSRQTCSFSIIYANFLYLVLSIW
jgi:hypothetical protein